ncbi:hypothetical protein KC19_2G104500 [Ceratodon purpureus]|uniref:VTT domain-containing protein n=1 Tax=Ceratodon purpureus TaxID=3225 RepID=A0A8T0IUY2_CERPU|nr:hypothetical protein KC19_2G104500 [Ceratodon purpureus]KAG0586626.1 hypothetical protein KC19_2G104500 [Ceratodon purpureus]
MAAALLSGALSFHVGVQRHPSQQEWQGDSAMASSIASVSGASCRGSSSSSFPYPAQLEFVLGFRGGKTSRVGGFVASSRVSSCMPLFLSSENPFRQQTRASLMHWSRNRARSVRVASLKDGQREALHEVDEQSKPIELGSPPVPHGSSENGSDRKEGEDTHSSEAPEEVANFVAAKADEDAASLKEEVKGSEQGMSGTVKGTIIAAVLLLACVGGFGALSFFYKEQINELLTQFSDLLEGYGPAGYVLFVLAYAGLEILAIPAVPLTMSAGLLFGTLYGTIMVSIAGTLAATVAFLIARYFARDRILKLAQNNPKFLAIDKAIGADSFRVVTLLRLSPLLPFSLGNYLYGLTSVELIPYVLGSWLGMLPGTWAYVSAGAIGRAFIKQEADAVFPGGPESYWTLGIGLVATIFAASYVGKLAKNAMKDIEDA